MCKLAKIGPGCPGINWMGDCTVYSPEGVLAREQRFGFCGYRNGRTPEPVGSGRAKRVLNPIKKSKKKGA